MRCEAEYIITPPGATTSETHLLNDPPITLPLSAPGGIARRAEIFGFKRSSDAGSEKKWQSSSEQPSSPSARGTTIAKRVTRKTLSP